MSIEDLRATVAEFDRLKQDQAYALQRVDDLTKVNTALVDENQKLSAEVERLKNPPVVVPPVIAPPVVVPPASIWQPLFEENFDKPASAGAFLAVYGPKWNAYPVGAVDTKKKGAYNPAIVSVANGIANIRLQTVNGVPQVAALFPRINPDGSTVQLYGRYEVRFRADAVDGYKFLCLLWPKSEVWPRDGEINFVEGDLTGTIKAFMHRQDAKVGTDQDAFSTRLRFTTWHTAVLEWMPQEALFFLDGKLIGNPKSRIPSTPMRLVLQAETELTDVMPLASAAGNVQIDYVKVWKYTG